MNGFLPSNEHTFQFRGTGERTKVTYSGTFKVKCLLNVNEQVEVALRHDSYTRQSKTLLPRAALLARAIAELEIRVIEKPAFWKDCEEGRSLLDENIVFEVFNAALEAEKVFEERVKAANKDAEESISKSAKKEKDKAANKAAE